MQARIVPPPTIGDPTRRHQSVREAAVYLGVSESTIRRTARRLGVRRFAGRAVAGTLLIAAHPFDIAIVFAEGGAR